MVNGVGEEYSYSIPAEWWGQHPVAEVAAVASHLYNGIMCIAHLLLGGGRDVEMKP